MCLLDSQRETEWTKKGHEQEENINIYVYMNVNSNNKNVVIIIIYEHASGTPFEAFI